AEAQAAALARAVRAEEQVRVDQELHDSIGHMLSMIVVQAGAGAHLFDRDPEFARHALTTIGDRGRAALGELDRIVAAIRADAAGLDGGAVPAGAVPSPPLPDLADLPALLTGARDAGMVVRARLRVD